MISKYAALQNPLAKQLEVKSMSKTFAARLNRLFDTV